MLPAHIERYTIRRDGRAVVISMRQRIVLLRGFHWAMLVPLFPLAFAGFGLLGLRSALARRR